MIELVAAAARAGSQTLFTGLGRTTGDRWKPQWVRQGTIELLDDSTPAQQPPSTSSAAR